MNRVIRNQRGMATEYVIMVVLVAIGALLIFSRFGGSQRDTFQGSSDRMAELDTSRRGEINASNVGTVEKDGSSSGSSDSGGSSGGTSVRVETAGGDAPSVAMDGTGFGRPKLDSTTIAVLAFLVVAVGCIFVLMMMRTVKKKPDES